MRTAAPHVGRKCTICCHPKVKAIDRELLEPGANITAIAARFDLQRHSVSRHRAKHVAPQLKAETVQAFEAGEAERAVSLQERVDGLFSKAEGLLDRMRGQGDFRGAVTAIREMRGCLELIGKLQGQIDQGTTINVFNGPAWVALQTNMLMALAPHPDARAAVVRVLEASLTVEAP